MLFRNFLLTAIRAVVGLRQPESRNPPRLGLCCFQGGVVFRASRALPGAKGETLSDLADNLQRFIAENISSVAQLEVLLLLKERPERWWNADEVARALYAGATLIADELAGWQSRGLLASAPDKPGGYRYAPQTPAVAAVVDALQDAYKDRRVSVITAIYSKPAGKIRTFADAFRIRKEP